MKKDPLLIALELDRNSRQSDEDRGEHAEDHGEYADDSEEDFDRCKDIASDMLEAIEAADIEALADIISLIMGK